MMRCKGAVGGVWDRLLSITNAIDSDHLSASRKWLMMGTALTRVARVAGIARRGFWAMGALVASPLLLDPDSALAACTITFDPNSVTCATTSTTNTTNSIPGVEEGFLRTSIDQTQQFTAGGGVTPGSSAGSVTGSITQNGLAIINTQAAVGTNADISFQNSGSISNTNALNTGNGLLGNGLLLQSNGGTITYTGNGSLSTTVLSNVSGTGLGALTVFNINGGTVSVGSAQAPVTGSFSAPLNMQFGGFGIVMGPPPSSNNLFNGIMNVYLAGGSIVATEGIKLDASASSNVSAAGSGSVNIVTTQNTSISASLAGIKTVTGAGSTTIVSDAVITNPTPGATPPSGLISAGIVSLSGVGPVSVTLGNGGSITGFQNGIFVSNNGTTVINNAGTISEATGTAVSVSGAGQASLNNLAQGIITGSISLPTSSGFSNAGTWNAPGTSSIGSLNNTGQFNLTGSATLGGLLSNSGTVALANGASLTATAAGISNLAGGTFAASGTSTTNGTFNNAGTINLRGPVAGNTLNINGSYVGSPGSSILFNFSSQTASADRVNITGTASGSTALSVFNLTPLAPFTTGVTLIQALGGIAPNTFTLANAQNFGTSSLVLLPQNGGATLALGSIPSVAGLSTGVALVAAQTIAFQASDAVFDHIWEVRDTATKSNSSQSQAYADEALGYAAKRNPDDAFAAFKAPPPTVGPTVRPAVWIKSFGDYVDQNGSAVVNFGGVTFPQDLGYRQRTGSVLAGADFLIKNITSANDALLLGALIGYENSHVDLKASPTTQNYDGASVGAYASYFNGNWFTDLLFKTDFLGVDVNGGGINQSANLINYDVSGNVGYKFDLPYKFYVEPTAGLEYVNSVFGGETAFSPSTIALNNGDATRGRIGARVGTEFITNDVRIEPSLIGYVYSILSATGNALVFSGTGITLPSDVNKVRGEIEAAVNFFNLKSGVSGFVRLDTRFGEGLTAGGVRVGLRYQM